jgi:hypothetical protein
VLFSVLDTTRDQHMRLNRLISLHLAVNIHTIVHYQMLNKLISHVSEALITQVFRGVKVAEYVYGDSFRHIDMNCTKSTICLF